MSVNAKVSGKALYLEFRHGQNTNQIIITPEGIASNGKAVPMTCYKRLIRPDAPRKTWRQVSSSFLSERDHAGAFVPLSMEHALSTAADKVGFTDNLFNQLLTQGWKLHVQPIAVEVTPEDLDDVRGGKTPYKILGRITRCRRTLNFGESLFAEAS